jgi:hypothetical protein
MTAVTAAVVLAWGGAASAESGAVSLAKGGKQPHAAVGPDGCAVVVWAAGDSVMAAVAPKAGDPFGAPVKVADCGGLMAGMRRGPRVAAAAGTIVATAIGKSDGNLKAWASSDGGATWSGPATVNGSGGAAKEGMSDLAAGPKGTFHAVWLDLRDGETQIWAAASADGGKTWTEAKVYKSPSGSVCECCNPSIGVDPQGKVYVLFRNSLEGNRDMYLVSSPDGGKTWGKAMKLGLQSWKLGQCPMLGGAVAAAGGKPSAIWARDNNLFLSGATGGEQPLGNGRFPWATAGPGGVFAVWQKGRDESPLFLMRARGGTAPLGQGAYAVVGGDPKAGVVAAWEADGGIVAMTVAKAGK